MEAIRRMLGGGDQGPGRVTSEPWGSYRGKEATLYTITNGGISCSISDLGATLVRLNLPNKEGAIADCVLGFDSATAYDEEDNKGPYFGATVGRVANRTAGGKFSVDGQEYTLAINNGPNSLHGGIEGFSWQFWSATVVDVEGKSPAVRFIYVAGDGEEGFPGRCTTTCTYTLYDSGELRVQMEAATTARCPVNLCNHSYFNLAGHDSGSVLGTQMHLNCDRFTPGNDVQVPTGELRSVEATPFDFRTPLPAAHTLGERIDDVAEADGHDASAGYDHNFVRATLAYPSPPPVRSRQRTIHLQADGVVERCGTAWCGR
jgi:aldose 1-epimerase